MGDVVPLRRRRTKHRLRLDADQRGHFLHIFPPPSVPNPTWRFADYDTARDYADKLSRQLRLKVHDAIRPPFLERFR